MKKFIFLFWLIFVTAGFSHAQTEITGALHLYSICEDSSASIRFSDAKALSIDLSGFLYVADTGNNRIMKFNSEGQFIKSIGGFGWENEQFYTPVDICATSALDVFVADFDNQRIQRYDKDLNYISSLNSDENWSERLQFGYPASIGISLHGELFLLDKENIRILKFNSFGEPEISFGDFAEGRGRLQNPVQLTISTNDEIYVSDSEAGKITVFDYFGNYLFELGENILESPQGIFFSSQKLLFVADTGNKQIAVFHPGKGLILKWDIISPIIGNFKAPLDVVTFEDNCYVLDNDAIHVFKLMIK